MIRVVLIALLLLVFFAAGFLLGRAGKRKRLRDMHVRTAAVVEAARRLVDADLFNSPQEALLRRREAQHALGSYDYERTL